MGIYNSCIKRFPKKAERILHCEFNSRNGCQHTLTVWKSKEHMLGFLTSPPHLKAMKKYSKIGSGKIYGYEAITIPSWDEALTERDKDKAKN